MSYSETITRADLTNILNSILPQSSYIQSWEYVGDVYWGSNTWTVPDDGFIEVYAEPSASNWYLRISDSKAPDTGWSHRMAGANNATVSQEFFVKKGAVLGTSSMSAVGTVHVWYYKFTLKETIPEPAADYIVEQGTNTNGTYRKWNSGILEQWGQVTTSASSGNVSVGITFPVAFVDTSYYLQAMPSRNFGLGQSLAENYYTSGNRQATTTQTTVSWYKSGNAYATEIRYFVIGRWK